MTLAPAASPAVPPAEPSPLVESVLRAAAGITGMQMVGVSAISAETYRVEKALGAFEGLDVGTSLPLSDTFCARLIGGAPGFTGDAELDPAYADVPLRARLGIRSYLGVPLRHQGSVNGTLCGFHASAVSVSTADLQVLTSLARVISAQAARDPQIVLRRTASGWEVEQSSGEVSEAADATLAMSLADLFAVEAGDLVPPQRPRRPEGELAEIERLQLQIAQLEHALSARVVIEQAIGVVAQRFAIAPREAFDRLRKSARSRGQRVHELATNLVRSARDASVELPKELR